MHCLSRKWLAEAVIWTKLKKREKRRMGKRIREKKRKQKKSIIKRKERRGQMKRMFVRKKHETGSRGGGGWKS